MCHIKTLYQTASENLAMAMIFQLLPREAMYLLWEEVILVTVQGYLMQMLRKV